MDNKLKQNNSNNEEKKLYYKSNISNDYFWNNIKQHPFSYGRGKIFFKIFGTSYSFPLYSVYGVIVSPRYWVTDTPTGILILLSSVVPSLVSFEL